MPAKTNNPLPFYALLTASFISVTGDAMARLALPWFVLQTTGSAAQTGITAFFTISPFVIGTLFGGVIVDRFGYKPNSLFADMMSGITVVLIPLLYITIGLPFWGLLALVFLGNLFDAPGSTARGAFLPDLAELAGLQLDRASAIMDGVSRGTSFVGLPLAGVLISQIGAVNVLWLNALSFAISFVIVALLVPGVKVELTSGELPENTQKGWVKDFLDGFRYIRDDRLLLVLMGTIMITNMLDTSVFMVVLPVYGEQVFGAEQGATLLGIYFGTFSGSAILGTILMGVYGGRVPRRPLFIVSFTIVALRFFIYAAYPPYWVLLLTGVITGISLGPVNPIIRSVQYERIPKVLRARVIGVLSSFVQVAMPIGVLLSGYFVEWFGLSTILNTVGVVYMTIILCLFLYPAMYQMDMNRAVAQTS